MRYPYAALLLCLACSSPEPRPSTLERGTYRPPARAPTFTPHERAPHHTGQPGHLRPVPQVQPNPTHKRYLPPEPDGRQGIWASDEPDPGKVEPKILGALMPIPSDVTDYDRKAAYKCVFIMNDFAIRASGGTMEAMTARLEKYTERERGCIAATLYATCLKSIKDHYNSEFERGAVYDPEVAVGLQRLGGAATKARDALCHHTPISEDGKRLRDDVIKKWGQAIGN